jgi:hypothetical protein
MKEHGTYHHGQHRSQGNIAPCCRNPFDTLRENPFETEALKAAAELRKMVESGRVITHPATLLDIAKRLEEAAR